jgi:hypothetical protein
MNVKPHGRRIHPQLSFFRHTQADEFQQDFFL